MCFIHNLSYGVSFRDGLPTSNKFFWVGNLPPILFAHITRVTENSELSEVIYFGY